MCTFCRNVYLLQKGTPLPLHRLKDLALRLSLRLAYFWSPGDQAKLAKMPAPKQPWPAVQRPVLACFLNDFCRNLAWPN
jgi:hypothetical protein